MILVANLIGNTSHRPGISAPAGHRPAFSHSRIVEAFDAPTLSFFQPTVSSKLPPLVDRKHLSKTRAIFSLDLWFLSILSLRLSTKPADMPEKHFIGNLVHDRPSIQATTASTTVPSVRFVVFAVSIGIAISFGSAKKPREGVRNIVGNATENMGIDFMETSKGKFKRTAAGFSDP